MSTQATGVTGSLPSQSTSSSLLEKLSSERALLIFIFIFAALMMLFYHPFSQIEGGDSAIYDYIAQSILRGQLPYRDVVDIKGPASVYLSAAAIAIGRLFRMHDVTTIRLFHILMVGLLSALTFRVGVVYLGSRLAGLIGALLMLISPVIIDTLIGGTQPKLPLMIFGLATLLLIAADRPFWAGVCGMMACLCWQPGLMFAGTAFLIFSKYLTSWRDLRAVKVVIGAALPLAIVVLYFYARGGLSDLWNYAMVYNYSVFGPEAKRPVAAAGSHLWLILRRVYEKNALIWLIGLVGLAVYIAERVAVKFKQGWGHEQFRDAIIFPAVIYLVFAFINFQAAPDLIPFLPFVGLFAAWAFIAAGRLIAAYIPAQMADYRPRIEQGIPALALVLALALVIWPALHYRFVGETLQNQMAEVNELAARLQPDDKIYTHGTIGMLVLMNRPNMNPYVFLDWDMDTFIAARKYNGSFQALLDEIEAAKPKLVGVSRLRAVTHGQEFEQWVNAHYVELPLRINKGVYIRKPE